MINLLLLFTFCIVLAYVVEIRTYSYENFRIGVRNDIQSRLCYIIMICCFILFSGLRTWYNDTSGYMGLFEVLVDDKISWQEFFKSYGGFETYQSLIKKYISTNPQALILISAILTNLLYIPFILKYSKNFVESIYLYCIGDLMFSMAGIKQSIAIGIALYAIDAYLSKKYFRAILLLYLAMTFHPYIICLVSVPLLTKKVWSFKTIFVVFVCAFLFMNMEIVFEAFSLIGRDYSEISFDHHTINPMRVLVQSIPIIISFIYKNKINKNDSIILKLGINMRIISFVFIFMGLFANPIYLGRMSSYFSLLSVVTIPQMLHICWDDEKNGNLYKIFYYILFFIYFVLDITKLGTYGLGYDHFRHTDIGIIFNMIGK